MQEAEVLDDLREAEALYEAWSSDFERYAHDLLKVQTIEGDLVPFQVNVIQRTFLRVIDDIRKNGRLVRIVVLKARRFGISTLTAGRFFWKTTCNPNRYALMVTHEPDATETIYNMHKRFYNNLPDPLKPKKKYENRRVLEFNDPKGGGGLDSAIRVGTAGKENFGSSQQVMYAHLSEMSKWPTHTTEPLLASLMQCVPRTADSEVIIESTANGVGGAFHSYYLSARYKYRAFINEKGEVDIGSFVDENAPENNAYSAVFFPWYIFPTYQISLAEYQRITGRKFVRTPDEEMFAAIHFKGTPEKIANEKLAWYRWCLENQCQGNEKIRSQEFPSTAEEAFISSGSAVFDAMQVIALREAAPEPVAKYEINETTGQFAYRKDGRLWVWEEMRDGESYAIIADVAEGIEISRAGGDVIFDFSVADIYHQLTGIQVAQWHGHIDADLFGNLLCFLGRRYNTAWLIPENNNHGKTTIASIVRNQYPKLYVQRVPDPPNKPRKVYGWNTNRATKPMLVDAAVAAMRDKNHGLRSRRTFDELLSFKKNEKGEYGADFGRHDDCVVTFGVAKHVIPTLPLPAGVQRVKRFTRESWESVTQTLPDQRRTMVGGWMS